MIRRVLSGRLILRRVTLITSISLALSASVHAADSALAALEQQLANMPGSLTRIEKLGEEQAGFAPVLGLGLLPQGKVVRGGVLLLHDGDQHPDWPDFTGPARQVLAGDGWHTLAIALSPVEPPARPERALPPRLADGSLPAAETKGAEGAAAPDAPDPAVPPALTGEAPADPATTEPAAVPTLTQFSDTERVALGLAWLGQQKVDNQVLVGVGQGADTALVAYASLNLASRDVVLVLVNAAMGFTEMNELLNQNPGLSEAVILDLHDSTSSYASALAKGRKTAMQRTGAKAYQQRAMDGIQRDLRQQHEPLIRSIRGWLRRFAPGMEVTR